MKLREWFIFGRQKKGYWVHKKVVTPIPKGMKETANRICRYITDNEAYSHIPPRGLRGRKEGNMTQTGILIAAFKAGKHLTNESARELCGTDRFAARVHDIKELGYQITDVWREGTNRLGNKTRFKEYWMVGENHEG